MLIVGAGPAGLSCALHLANLIKTHNESGAKPELSPENIYVLEKGREIGAHQLSGAIMNPKAMPFDGMRMFMGGFKPITSL